MPLPSLTGKVLKGTWRLGELVGTGACADVYEVTGVSDGVGTQAGKFVAKIAPLPADSPPQSKKKHNEEKRNANMLFYERTLYQGYLRPLRDPGCVVKVRVHGQVEIGLLNCGVVERSHIRTYIHIRPNSIAIGGLFDSDQMAGAWPSQPVRDGSAGDGP